MSIAEMKCSMDNFSERLLKRLKDFYGEEYAIEIREVKRNNDCVKRGLIIKRGNEKTTPTIYIDDFYEKYIEGETLFDITSEIIEIRNIHNMENDIDVDFMLNYEQVCKKLGIKLINKNRNKEMLSTLPYVEFADMIIVFLVIIEEESIGRGAILIKNEIFDKWNISKERLYADAISNMMKKFPPNKCDIIDMLIGMYREKHDDGTDFAKEEMKDYINEMENLRSDEKGMYVLTNSGRWYGASAMAYPQLLEEIGKSIGKDYFILPSSIHEVILVPCDEEVNYGQLSDMVKAVNENAVEVEEVLSDHAYRYHRANNWLEPLV